MVITNVQVRGEMYKKVHSLKLLGSRRTTRPAAVARFQPL
jgi:hypothetical protein